MPRFNPLRNWINKTKMSVSKVVILITDKISRRQISTTVDEEICGNSKKSEKQQQQNEDKETKKEEKK